VVDLAGNPLLDLRGNPLLDVNGDPLEVPVEEQLSVNRLPLSGPISLEYYYTYGNLLAYLQECEPNQAPKYLNAALNAAPDDPTVLGSFEESMALCMNGGPLVDPDITGTEGDPALGAAVDGTGVAEITPTPSP
jgi:hypothetical protein